MGRELYAWQEKVRLLRSGYFRRQTRLMFLKDFEIMKQNGVSKCKPLLKLDEPQTSYISITKGSDVAIILDNIMPFLMVSKKVQEAKIVREFLSKRKRKPV